MRLQFKQYLLEVLHSIQFKLQGRQLMPETK